MAIAMADKGHEVSFLLDKQGIISQRLDNRVKQIHISIGRLSFLNRLLYHRLLKVFKHNSFDAVVINSPTELKVVAPAAKAAGIKHVIYRRGSDVSVKNNWLNRYLLEGVTDKIIANSQATKASLLATGLKIDDKIVVINNGVHAPQKEYLNVNNKLPVIGAVGRLSPQKGFDILIDTVYVLKHKGVQFILKIAGEGSERAILEAKIQEKGLEDTIELVGFQENVYSFLGGCDIFALSSRYEGFGYVMVEAMFSQLPVVAFNISSAQEIIEHGVTGFLVKPYDINEFSDALQELIQQRGLCAKLGSKGYERAFRDYNFEKSTVRLLNLISG